jgi:hexosaminidase
MAACLFSTMLSSCSNQSLEMPALIPQPVEVAFGNGILKCDSNYQNGGKELVFVEVDSTATEKTPEAYQLKVDKNGISIKAASDAGVFYAMQTLNQLRTAEGVPFVEINDYPRFQYRGLHLDVSRHFFTKEEVYKLIDAMSAYKLNTLHLHLTDAGGWRYQSDAYPNLTKETAYRTESDWRKWWDGKERKYLPEGTDGAYGGYYTKDDLKDIVKYASEKHINVIPEVEFPGHSNEVLVAYPELSCSNQPYKNGDFCIGNPATFEFMDTILDELIEIFPSEYIHIGGDEAGKDAWKTCKKCQSLMRKEGLKDVDELQSYMIHHADSFLVSRGRKMIGWDEIMEGGLSPDATVMSWRGEEAGISAANMGHDVVMTPGKYMYFDFYQADPTTQPYAIGGYTPIKKVYSYNPAPDTLSPEVKKHILGLQANTWTEYIPTESHLEYMMFPRALAVAEIGWTSQEKRDWESFKQRVNKNIPVLQSMGLNPFTLSDELEVTMNVDTTNKSINVYLDAERYPAEIRYTTDGTTPTALSTLYNDRITVKDSADIVAAIFRDGQLQGEPTKKSVDYHKGIGKFISFNSKLYSGYMAGGENALIDGYRGGLTYLDGRWQGYLDDLDCVIDMGEETDINEVSSRFMQLIGPGVYQPSEVELLLSSDGETYQSVGVVPTEVAIDNSDLAFQEYAFTGDWKARYVRLKAKRPNKGFIFVDEIVIW